MNYYVFYLLSPNMVRHTVRKKSYIIKNTSYLFEMIQEILF